jgi:hypothetical protein
MAAAAAAAAAAARARTSLTCWMTRARPRWAEVAEGGEGGGRGGQPGWRCICMRPAACSQQQRRTARSHWGRAAPVAGWRPLPSAAPHTPQVLALAKKMLRRRDATDVMEAAYNRFAFHDDKLPRWFAEDESRHMRWVGGWGWVGGWRWQPACKLGTAEGGGRGERRQRQQRQVAAPALCPAGRHDAPLPARRPLPRHHRRRS